LIEKLNGIWRQGQLPSGQTAKARPDYRVQSLRKGHDRHIPSAQNGSIHILKANVCAVVNADWISQISLSAFQCVQASGFLSHSIFPDSLGARIAMSELSEKLAPYVLRAKERRPETKQDGHEEVLDKGFALLKEDLAREFHDQINELNGEPGCMDTLGSAFVDKASRVFRFAEEDKGLTIDFDAVNRTVELKGTEPIKFHYLIQVTLAKDKKTWSYLGGENKAELTPITGKLDMVVEKALFALFGVEA
jgi:hypothetical protein